MCSTLVCGLESEVSAEVQMSDLNPFPCGSKHTLVRLWVHATTVLWCGPPHSSTESLYTRGPTSVLAQHS